MCAFQTFQNCTNYASRRKTNAHSVPASLPKLHPHTVIFRKKAFFSDRPIRGSFSKTHSWHVSPSAQKKREKVARSHSVVQEEGVKKKEKRRRSHQLYRDPCSRSRLMWQWAPRSSPDQSPPNRSPVSRRDRAGEANISPCDPLLCWR